MSARTAPSADDLRKAFWQFVDDEWMALRPLLAGLPGRIGYWSMETAVIDQDYATSPKSALFAIARASSSAAASAGYSLNKSSQLLTMAAHAAILDRLSDEATQKEADRRSMIAGILNGSSEKMRSLEIPESLFRKINEDRGMVPIGEWLASRYR